MNMIRNNAVWTLWEKYYDFTHFISYVIYLYPMSFKPFPNTRDIGQWNTKLGHKRYQIMTMKGNQNVTCGQKQFCVFIA